MPVKKSKRLQLTLANGKVGNLFLPSGTREEERVQIKKVLMRLIQGKKTKIPCNPVDQQFCESYGETFLKQIQRLGISFSKKDENLDKYRLCNYLSKFLKSRRGTSEKKLTLVSRRLETFFNPETDMREITKTDADSFKKYLIEVCELAEFSTARRSLSHCSQVWEQAIQDDIVTKNPWKSKDNPKTVLPNEEKHHYVTPEETLRIWNAIQTDDDRVRFVLLRYLGLRSPSEIDALRWKDFDWTEGRETVQVRSMKTRHHKNGGKRTVPITHPDVLPVLKKAYERRKSDNKSIVPVITHTSLTKRVKGWLGAAGLNLWPKLLVNFRRSAVTDACQIYASHIVARYFGHSEAISDAFYRMETEEQSSVFATAKPLIQKKGSA